MAKPSLIEIDNWYVTTILPKRTAAAGGSFNRFYKSPAGLFRGNKDDPNGLCGDTSTFLSHKYEDAFKMPITADGLMLGMILWQGTVLNHIANVMLPQKKAVRQKFVTVGPVTTNMSQDNAWKQKHQRKVVQAADVITGSELLGLRVYDLYYKMKPTTVGEWWKFLDSGMNGAVEVGPESDFAE